MSRKLIVATVVAAAALVSCVVLVSKVHDDPHTQTLVGFDSDCDSSRVGAATQLQQLASASALSLDEIHTDQGAVEGIIDKLTKLVGPQGPRGPPGPAQHCGDGAPGKRGAKGKAGINGKPGEPGAPGIKGLGGKDGAVGLPGREGERGPFGNPGSPGFPGKPGEHGSKGDDGIFGSAGHQGDPGRPGSAGAPGRPGTQGARGSRGRPGRSGPVGPDGMVGRDGLPGAPGAPGRRGVEGEQGQMGFRGEVGGVGFDGPKGPKGPPGYDGKDARVLTERAHVFGTAINAANGKPIERVHIAVDRGSLPVGDETSNDSGQYMLQLDAGVIDLTATKEGFYPSLKTVNIVDAKAVRRADLVLSPVLHPRQLRFVVTWDSDDLDLEVLLRTPDGCIVSRTSRTCSHAARELNGDDAVAALELAQSATKARAIVVRHFMVGEYRLLVRQTSQLGKLKVGGVVARIYSADSPVHVLSFSPGASGRLIGEADRGRTWLVATIDGDMVLDGSGLGAVRSVASLPAAEAEEIVDHAVKSVFVSRAKTALDALSSSARRRFDAQQRRTANAALTLTVKNAVDGTRVGGAMVTLVTVDDDQVKHARASAGGRLIARVPYGTYKAYARKEGMHAVTETFVVNKASVEVPVLLAPPLDRRKKQIRVIVRWDDADAAPRDLDAYLQTPYECTVWYRRRACEKGSAKARLDYDDTIGKGPETITIDRGATGKYIVYVKQYSRDGTLDHSGATVSVFLSDGAENTFRVNRNGVLSANVGRGQVWAVAEIDAEKQTAVAATRAVLRRVKTARPTGSSDGSAGSDDDS